MSLYKNVKNYDLEIYNALIGEKGRQASHIELIASENFVSPAILEAVGSILTNKYAEGYPHKRYYGGCQYVDIAEDLAIERGKKLFNAKYANVQPHSGSQANIAAYYAALENGDTILGMDLNHGGHLTHGSPVNFSGRFFKVISYGVDKVTGLIDYEDLERIAVANKPKLILAGASAYSRKIDFKEFRRIADKVGAYLMVDMAHIAGIVAAGYHDNPCEYADIVTTTTHKTLRGPRGGAIFTNNDELGKKINSQIFPGFQGGPLMHVIAAKAIAFKEAMEPSFKDYIKQVLNNASTLSNAFKDKGFDVISGGTDNHMFLINVYNKGITGKAAQTALDKANITTNKNMLPFDTQTPFVTSGIRIGSPAVTTMGMKEQEMKLIADYICEILADIDNTSLLEDIKHKVIALTSKFQLYKDL